MINDLYDIQKTLAHLMAKVDNLIEKHEKTSFVEWIKFNNIVLNPAIYDTAKLLDDNNKVAVLGSRRVGVTTLLSLYALYAASSKRNQKVVVFANTTNQCETIRDIIINAMNYPQNVAKITKTQIVFNNNSTITFGSTESFLRGHKPTHLVIDNTGYFIKQPTFLQPLLNSEDVHVLAGTTGVPHDYQNLFLQLWFNPLFKKKLITWRRVGVPFNEINQTYREYGYNRFIAEYIDVP